MRNRKVRERTVVRSVATSSAIEGRNRRVVAAGECRNGKSMQSATPGFPISTPI